jgi:hypothetical protein
MPGRKRTSIIWTIPSDELQKIMDSSNSLREVLRKLSPGSQSCGNFKALKNRIANDLLDLSSLQERRRLTKRNNIHRQLSLDDILTLNSTFRITSHVKERIVEEGLLEYKCSICDNNGKWLGNPITLQIDHINGDCCDHRIENLRFLCPNCHVQTETWGAKNVKQPSILQKRCCDCKMTIYSKSSRCNSCRGKKDRKFEITKDELEDLLLKQNKSYVEIGKRYNVNGNSIKKRAKKLGIDIPRRR